MENNETNEILADENPQRKRRVTHYIAVNGRRVHTCRTCGPLDTEAPRVHAYNTGHIVTSS